MAISEGNSTSVVMVGSWNVHPLVGRGVVWITNEEPVIDRAGAFINENPKIDGGGPHELSELPVDERLAATQRPHADRIQKRIHRHAAGRRNCAASNGGSFCVSGTFINLGIFGIREKGAGF